MIPETLVNMNHHVDGRGYAGVVLSVSPPKLTIKTDEHRAGGMDGPVELDLGLEKLEASFSHAGYQPELAGTFGLANGSAYSGVMRGAFRDTVGTVKGVALTLRGMLKEIDPGDWKPGEKAETKYSVAVKYYKAEVDGVVVHEIDPIANIRIINGADQNAAIRAALGQ